MRKGVGFVTIFFRLPAAATAVYTPPAMAVQYGWNVPNAYIGTHRERRQIRRPSFFCVFTNAFSKINLNNILHLPTPQISTTHTRVTTYYYYCCCFCCCCRVRHVSIYMYPHSGHYLYIILLLLILMACRHVENHNARKSLVQRLGGARRSDPPPTPVYLYIILLLCTPREYNTFK